MTRRTAMNLLAVVCVLSTLLLLVFLSNRDLARDEPRPRDAQQLALWLTKHPADAIAAAELTDRALDASSPSRIELWHASRAMAKHLAPRRPNGDAAFLRGGLFHWYELDARNRHEVLAASEPFLRDPKVFPELHKALWSLTRDFALLRRANPGTSEALTTLRDLAITNGLFADFRAMREQLRGAQLAEFEQRAPDLAPEELANALPSTAFDARDLPLVKRYLGELHNRPLDAPPQRVDVVERITDFALRHGAEPLDGLEDLVRSESISDVLRARLALGLHAKDAATQIEMTRGVAGSAAWVPYFVERAVIEAEARDAHLAAAYLARAAAAGMTAEVLATEERVARLLGNDAVAARTRSLLLAQYAKPSDWAGLCSGGDLCTRGTSSLYAVSTTLNVATVQSDEVPPYVEIYIDDALTAEGEVRQTRAFDLQLGDAPQLHRVEVRLANPFTRNRLQRRVRLS